MQPVEPSSRDWAVDADGVVHWTDKISKAPEFEIDHNVPIDMVSNEPWTKGAGPHSYDLWPESTQALVEVDGPGLGARYDFEGGAIDVDYAQTGSAVCSDYTDHHQMSSSGFFSDELTDGSDFRAERGQAMYTDTEHTHVSANADHSDDADFIAWLQKQGYSTSGYIA